MYHLHIHDIHDRFVNEYHWHQASSDPSSFFVGRLYVLVAKAFSTASGKWRCTSAMDVHSHHVPVPFVVSHITLYDYWSFLTSLSPPQRPSVVFSIDSPSNLTSCYIVLTLIVLVLTRISSCVPGSLSSLYFYHTLFSSCHCLHSCCRVSLPFASYYMYYLGVFN